MPNQERLANSNTRISYASYNSRTHPVRQSHPPLPLSSSAHGWHIVDNASHPQPQHTSHKHFSHTRDTRTDSHLLCHRYPYRRPYHLPQLPIVRRSLRTAALARDFERVLFGRRRWVLEPAALRCSRKSGVWISGAWTQQWRAVWEVEDLKGRVRRVGVGVARERACGLCSLFGRQYGV